MFVWRLGFCRLGISRVCPSVASVVLACVGIHVERVWFGRVRGVVAWFCGCVA